MDDHGGRFFGCHYEPPDEQGQPDDGKQIRIPGKALWPCFAILRVRTERNKELPRMIVWTEYMKYQEELRGFDLSLV